MIRMFSQYVILIIALLSLARNCHFLQFLMLLCARCRNRTWKKRGWVRLKEQRHCVSILIVCKKTTLLSWVMAFRKNAEVLLQICPNFRISMLAWRETLKETLKKIVIDADWCGKENYHHSSKEARHTNLGGSASCSWIMLNLEALTFGFDYDIWMGSIRAATQTLTAP